MLTINLFGYYRFLQEKEHINQTINETLIRSVGIASVLVGDEYHNRVALKAPSLEEENILIKKLSTMAKAEEVEYIYTIVQDENKTLHFTSSSATDEELRTGKNLTHFYDVYETDSKIKDAFKTNQKIFTEITDQWGHFRSIFVGFKTQNGNQYLIGVDIRIDSIESLSRMAAFKAMLGSLVIFFGSLPFLLLYRHIAQKNHVLLSEQIEIATKELQETRDKAIIAMHHAQEANRAKDLFLSNMSHELRTPLNAIIGFAQILVSKDDTPTSIKSFIEKILISGKNLLTLVNTILDFSKIEAGKMEVHKKPFVLKELIDEVFILIEPMIEKKHLTLLIPILDNLIVNADRQLIKQVFVNLLSNAIKFSPENKTIEIAYKKLDHHLQIAIIDQGIGIAQDKIETLFDPFVQIREDQTEATKGTGLGLTIVKKIVEMHGGKIWVQSSSKEGSRFYFTISL
jgi:signal transduction histidine kinase